MDVTGLPGGPQVAPGPTPGLTAQEGSKGEHPGSAGHPGLQEKLAWKGWSPSLGCLGRRAGQPAQGGGRALTPTRMKVWHSVTKLPLVISLNFSQMSGTLVASKIKA